MTRSHRVLAGTAVAVAVLVTGGLAWAHWGVTGTATVSGTTGRVVTLTASAAPVDDAPLYPGATRDLRVTVRNDNAFPVTVTEVRRGPAGVRVDAAHTEAGCRSAGVSITDAVQAASWPVAGQAAASFTLPGAITMSTASDSACQGASFRLPLVVTGVAR